MDHELLVKRIALKHGLPDKVVKSIVESPYLFASEELKKLDFDSIETKEEFDKLATNFNFKYLFTLYTSHKIHEKLKYKKNKGDETKGTDN